jgi:hypothetical protein
MTVALALIASAIAFRVFDTALIIAFSTSVSDPPLDPLPDIILIIRK